LNIVHDTTTSVDSTLCRLVYHNLKSFFFGGGGGRRYDISEIFLSTLRVSVLPSRNAS
jgi:hypothetical protein